MAKSRQNEPVDRDEVMKLIDGFLQKKKAASEKSGTASKFKTDGLKKVNMHKVPFDFLTALVSASEDKFSSMVPSLRMLHDEIGTMLRDHEDLLTKAQDADDKDFEG